MITGELPLRGTDDWGSGEFEASRGSNKHKGIDYACYPDTVIHSIFEGEVTKLGYCYKDALEFRYVEITDSKGNRHRQFYVYPTVKVGNYVSNNWPVGISQDVSGYYKLKDSSKVMKNHVHYEILDKNNDPINPKGYKL